MKRRTFTILSVVLLLTVMGILLLWDRSNWSRHAVLRSEQVGNEIVGALEDYRKDHGRFPLSLDALVPKYLSVVQPPEAGQRVWPFVSDGEHHFNLAVRSINVSSGGPAMWWQPGYKRWAHDTGAF